jgi:D-glycero-D-manno-heptose 1,7-bisphosphate phosphatase
MNRAVFLDRDGVINRKAPEGLYITRWEEMEFLPGVPEAISLLGQAGFCVLTVSNQRCVAKGLLTIDELESMHVRMCEELAAAGAVIKGVYYCPHEEQPACACRKPAPGMILRAALEHSIDLPGSWMAGDSDSDIEAGRSAGCRTARILRPNEFAGVAAEVCAQSLLDATRQILQLDSVPTSQARRKS